MANELTLNGSMVYLDADGTTDTISIASLLVNVTTHVIARIKVSIGTSAQALSLGNVASLGYAFFINRDVTNYIDIFTSNGGVDAIRLKPGQFAILPIGPGITAPYAQANTAACLLDYLLISQ